MEGAWPLLSTPRSSQIVVSKYARMANMRVPAGAVGGADDPSSAAAAGSVS